MQLDDLYKGCTHENCKIDHYHFTMSNEDEWATKLAKELALEAQRIWKKKGMPDELNNSITQAYANIFMDAVGKGFGEIDYTTPDSDMLHSITKNVYQFSAAKNYTQMRQLSQALIGEDGKLRTFSQFKKVAFEINQTHAVNHLQAEYDTAIASAQMARKWSEIQANKKTLPLLQFDAVIDGQTSDVCRPLDRIIKPVDDPFWNIYYPPNHFRCRSMANQLSGGRVTPDHAIVHPTKGIPDMFKTNMAKTGMIFPSGHPYWIGVPTDVLEATIKLYPYDAQFDKVDDQLYKGKLRVHKLLKKGDDYDLHLQIGAEKASKGHRVDILPAINEHETQWRQIIYPDANKKTNADLRIDGILTEVKSPLKPLHKNKLSHSISKASRQAPHIIINLKNKVSKGQQFKLVTGKFKDHKKMKQVEFRYEGNYQAWRR